MAVERTIRIKVDGDGKGLIITARTAEKELERLGRKVDEVNKRVAGSAVGLAKFAAAASLISNSTGAVAGFGATLTTATGALIGLPAVAAAGGAAMGTIKLGADGIARAFTGVNRTLLPLKAQVAGTFEQGLAPAVDNLNRLLPTTADNFSAIAREMSGVAEAATGTLALPEHTAELNTLLGRTAGLMSGARRAASPLTAALLDIVSVGSEGFFSLGDRIAASSREFAGFIQRARESGQLRAWLDNGINAAREMWQTVKDLGAIVRGVFSGISEGAGGISNSLQPAIKRMREFVESTRGQEWLRRIGAALAEIGQAVGDTLGAGLAVAGPLAASLAQTLAVLASTAAGILVPTLTILAPLLQAIAAFMAENEQLVRVLVTGLGGLAVAYLSVHGAIKVVNQATAVWNTVSGLASSRAAGMGTAYMGMGRAARIASLSMGAIGIAISVIGAAMALFSSDSSEAAARQEELAASARSVAEAIREENGAITQNVRARAAQLASEEGLLRWGAQYGITSRQVVDALLGEAAARDTVRAKLDAYIKQVEAVEAKDQGAKAFNAAAADGARNFAEALGTSSEAISEQSAELDRQADGARASTSATQSNTDAVRENIDALTEQMNLLKEAAGVVLDVREAENQYYESVQTASQAIEENGRTLNAATEKGRANRSALDDVAKSTLDLIAAQAANGKSSTELTRTMDAGRAAFIRTARQMGLNETQAAELANQLGLIPSNVTSNVKVVGIPTAREQLRNLYNVWHNRQLSWQVSIRNPSEPGRLGLGGQYTRATGGPVVGGGTYLVGERGPELFRAPNSGHIVPNHELAGMGGDTVVYVTIDGQQLQGRIDRTVRENNRAIARAVGAGTGLAG